MDSPGRGDDLNASNNEIVDLISACRANKLETARAIIQASGKVTYKNSNLTTALHWSAFWGNLELVRLLIKAGANINSADINGIRPLHLAVISQNIEVIKLLVIDGSYPDNKGITPLHLAAYFGYDELIEKLMRIPAIKRHTNERDRNSITPVNLAASCNNLSSVEALVSGGALIDIPDLNLRLPIHWAAVHGNTQMLSVLLQAENSLKDNVDENGHTALFIASILGHEDAIEFLLHHGCHIKLNSGLSDWYFELTNLRTLDDFILSCLKNFSNLSNVVHWALVFCPMETVLEMINSCKQRFNIQDDYRNTPMHTAAAFGRFDLTVLILEENAHIDLENSDGSTPLDWAAAHGHIEIVRLLTINKVKISKSVFWASANGHLDIVKYLTEINAGVNHQDSFGESPLVWASRNSQLDVFHYLMSVGARYSEDDNLIHLLVQNNWRSELIIMLQDHFHVNKLDLENRTPLHYAAITGNHEIAEILLNHDADPNIMELDKGFPIHYAIQYDHISIVNLLIERGADINKKGSHYCDYETYPICYAAALGKLEILQRLIRAGADVNTGSKPISRPINIAVIHRQRHIVKYLISIRASLEELIHTTALHGNVTDLEELVEIGININQLNHKGSTPLFMGVINTNLDNIKFLLANGADIEHRNVDGLTAFCEATVYQNIHAMQKLFEVGANINVKFYTGSTPLHYAVKNRLRNIFDFLIKNGADVNIPDTAGATPLMSSMYTSRDKHFMESLLSHNARLNDKNHNGSTALHLSTRLNIVYVELLLDYGADVNVSNNDGRTPLSLAVSCGKSDIARLLLIHGADVNLDPDLVNDAWNPYRQQMFQMLVNTGVCFKSTTPLNLFLQPLENINKIPLSLMCLCRIQCRKNYGRDYKQIILRARIPQKVKDFLFFKDFI